jgi:hypothetical protein
MVRRKDFSGPTEPLAGLLTAWVAGEVEAQTAGWSLRQSVADAI